MCCLLQRLTDISPQKESLVRTEADAWCASHLDNTENLASIDGWLVAI